MPERLQRKRSKGWRLPAGAVCADRSTRWGNPYKVGDENAPDRAAAVAFFETMLAARRTRLPDVAFPQYPSDEEIRAKLRGKSLACWCPLPEPGQPDHCHAAVLLAWIAMEDSHGSS